MNILTYNICLKPVVFELIKDNLNNKNFLTYSIDFIKQKNIIKNLLE